MVSALDVHVPTNDFCFEHWHMFMYKFNFSRGHCLMGQLHESTGQLEKAVASYRR